MNNELPAVDCNEIRATLILFIDHELPSPAHYQQFEVHFQGCPPCNQVMVREMAEVALMQDILRNSCNEVAPDELTERIHATISALTATQTIEFFSQTTVTEISFDGITSIGITHEFTQEIRHEFPNE